LHHPPKINGKRLDILSKDPEVKDFYLWYVDREHTLVMRTKIEEILKICGNFFLWEDTIEGLFSYANPYLFQDIIVPLNLVLNVDISHAFI
jgi:hypothetical protein